MEIKHIPAWIAEREKYWNYYRNTKLRIKKHVTKGKFSREKSGGLASWKCSNYYKKITAPRAPDIHMATELPTSLSLSLNQPNQLNKCLAKFTINFPSGYFHNEDGSINCKDFGDQVARITWNRKHNHEIHTPEAFNGSPLTKRVKAVLRDLIEHGCTWDQMQAKKDQDENFYIDDQIQSELLKINYGHFRYRSNTFQDQRARKHKLVNLSLPLWAKEIGDKGGLAEFYIRISITKGWFDARNVQYPCRP